MKGIDVRSQLWSDWKRITTQRKREFRPNRFVPSVQKQSNTRNRKWRPGSHGVFSPCFVQDTRLFRPQDVLIRVGAACVPVVVIPSRSQGVHTVYLGHLPTAAVISGRPSPKSQTSFRRWCNSAYIVPGALTSGEREYSPVSAFRRGQLTTK